MLFPLIKELKTQGHHITAVHTSPWPFAELLQINADIDVVFSVSKKSDLLGLGLKYRKAFDRAYLDYFAATRTNLLFAGTVAQQIVTNHLPEKSIPGLNKEKITLVSPQMGIHETEQNLRLLDLTTIEKPDLQFTLKENDLHSVWQSLSQKFDFPHQNLVAIQPTGGNNQTPHKNWPLENWSLLIDQLLQTFSNYHLVVLGDHHETEFSIPRNAKVHSLIGKTNLIEVTAILNQCSLFIGPDSGLMHLSAFLQTPTLTLWGGSDPALFGYEKLNAAKHKIVIDSPACHPCNSWINPNTTRVNDPLSCPDFKCIRQITVEKVALEIKAHALHLGLI